MDLSILDQISEELQAKQSQQSHNDLNDKISLENHGNQSSLPASLRPRALHRRLQSSSTEQLQVKPVGLIPASSKSNDKKSKETSTESAWHEIPRVQLTQELKRDIRLLQLRDTLDPKRFYKKGTFTQSLSTKNKKNPHLPAPTVQIQIGTIVDTPLSRYNRLTNKERTKTISEQVLREEKSSRYFKQKVGKFAEERTRKYGGNWKMVRNKRLRGSFKKSLRK